VLTPLTAGLTIWVLVNLFTSNGELSQNVFNLILSFSLALAVLVSRIYALKNQDRIIRVEMRLRYFELTGKSFSTKEPKLKLSQIIALRFANDNELLPLIDSAISEKMSSKEIKQAIKNWNPDYRRV
jgi:uncharacterized protein (DUF58 family)